MEISDISDDTLKALLSDTVANYIIDLRQQVVNLEKGNKGNIDKLYRLEKLRPHWAKGYSSDSIAAQSKTDALNSIWSLLKVNNQTHALCKIKSMMARLEIIKDEVQE